MANYGRNSKYKKFNAQQRKFTKRQRNKMSVAMKQSWAKRKKAEIDKQMKHLGKHYDNIVHNDIISTQFNKTNLLGNLKRKGFDDRGIPIANNNSIETDWKAKYYEVCAELSHVQKTYQTVIRIMSERN